jgi:hypothetical protein
MVPISLSCTTPGRTFTTSGTGTLMSQHQLHHVDESAPLHRTVSIMITSPNGKMVTWFVTSPPTDNRPQPKEALPTVSQL